MRPLSERIQEQRSKKTNPLPKSSTLRDLVDSVNEHHRQARAFLDEMKRDASS